MATGGTSDMMEDKPVTGISIDTRTLQKGDLFIALQGPKFDGHDFIAQARQRGAVAILASKGEAADIIKVPDTLRALHDLAAAARARSTAKIFAITGSVGKTSTKEALARCLSVLGKTHAAEASLNNHWGVPLSLARMPQSAAYGVFEIGMNHANEISPLSKLVSPAVSLITTIASAHIEHLGSLDNIARAKSEIFHGMDANGTVILPRDSAQFEILLAEARTQGIQNILTFGQTDDATFRLVESYSHESHTEAKFNYGAKIYDLLIGMPGKHHAMNSLAVLAAVLQVTPDIEKVFPALHAMQPVAGRGNRWSCQIKPHAPAVTIIDETHNASPVAVRAALDVLTTIPTMGRRLVALGDMLELGTTAVTEHENLKDDLLAANVDQVFTCGKLMAHLAKALPFGRHQHFGDSAALAAQIGELIQPGDVLLVKGSRGSQMKLVIQALQQLHQETQQALASVTS